MFWWGSAIKEVICKVIDWETLKKDKNFFFGFLEKGDCVGCLASLTQTILGCATTETGIGIAICVAGIVGVGNTCYPCICWAIEQVLGREDWYCDWCDCKQN